MLTSILMQIRTALLTHFDWQSVQVGLWEKRRGNPFPRLLLRKTGKPCLCGPRGSRPWRVGLRWTQPAQACGGLHPGLSEGLAEVLRCSRSKTKISPSSAEALCGAAQSGFVLNAEDRVASACVQDMWKKALQADVSLKLSFLYILQTESLVCKWVWWRQGFWYRAVGA